MHLDENKRSCEEQQCAFIGSYSELQIHAQLEHPHACHQKLILSGSLIGEKFSSHMRS